MLPALDQEKAFEIYLQRQRTHNCVRPTEMRLAVMHCGRDYFARVSKSLSSRKDEKLLIAEGGRNLYHRLAMPFMRLVFFAPVFPL